MASSISSFEMLDKGVHKGVGVKKIAELYGIQYKHTAASGTISMIMKCLKVYIYPLAAGKHPRQYMT